MENYTEFLKIIKEIMMKMQWSRLIWLSFVFLLGLLIWRLPEILAVILK